MLSALRPTLEPHQIAGFIARYDLDFQALAQAARAWLRHRLPTATELVYDNYNALVFGYGPSDRASAAVLSLALYPSWIRLFFLHGATLPDPMRLLTGTGRQVFSLVLTRAAVLEQPEVASLIDSAIAAAPVPFPLEGPFRSIVKSVSARRRPRRPPPPMVV